jgi:hypothetical protein
MASREDAQRGFQIHATVWFVVNAFLFMIWLITTAPGHPWFLYPAGAWGAALAIHAVAVFNRPPDDELEPGESYREIGS